MSGRVGRVAILASGEGTNAERLIQTIQATPGIEVVMVGCNRSKAGVLRRAQALDVPCHVFTKADLEGGELAELLVNKAVDFIALAGFLLKIPREWVDVYAGRMINLHPSLLPAFGGKGMYGHHVHAAVSDALQRGEIDRTGITLHWVTEEFDEGEAFFQVEVALDRRTDTPESIAAKVAELEAAHYAPEVLRAIAQSLSLSGTPLS